MALVGATKSPSGPTPTCECGAYMKWDWIQGKWECKALAHRAKVISKGVNHDT